MELLSERPMTHPTPVPALGLPPPSLVLVHVLSVVTVYSAEQLSDKPAREPLPTLATFRNRPVCPLLPITSATEPVWVRVDVMVVLLQK